jgi:hypothetical protein
LSDRVLLYGADGGPVARQLDGDDARNMLLLECFGRLLGHPSQMPAAEILAKIEQAVTVEAIKKRFPDIQAHIQRTAMRQRAQAEARTAGELKES